MLLLRRLASLAATALTPRIRWASASSTTKPAAGLGQKSFAQLGLREPCREALKEMQIASPTPVQELVIPAWLKGHSVLFAGATGSGKTLAYLLPLAQRLKDEETATSTGPEEAKDTDAKPIARRPHRPRAVVVVPTRELAYQVHSVAKQISHHVKLRAAALSGGTKLAPQRKALEAPVDVLIATPGRFLQLREKGLVYFTDVRYLVLDEADTLFGSDFAAAVDKIITPIRNNPRQRVQAICVSATLPDDKVKIMRALFPRAQLVLAPRSHQNPTHVVQEFVRVGPRDKFDRLLDVIQQHRHLRTLVFCSTIASCRAAEHFLREKGLPTVCFHGGILPERRAQHWALFQREADAVAVCTDAAARGLDTIAVEHVIMADFPHSGIDYLHRIGRTGRAGRPGRATCLVGKREAPLATAIERARERGEPIEALTLSGVIAAEKQKSAPLPLARARAPAGRRAAFSERLERERRRVTKARGGGRAAAREVTAAALVDARRARIERSRQRAAERQSARAKRAASRRARAATALAAPSAAADGVAAAGRSTSGARTAAASKTIKKKERSQRMLKASK